MYITLFLELELLLSNSQVYSMILMSLRLYLTKICHELFKFLLPINLVKAHEFTHQICRL